MSATPSPQFTEIQQRMVDLLADGEPHSVDELKRCLWDELSLKSSIQFHISRIRPKIKHLSQDILHNRKDGQTFYTMVRIISLREVYPSQSPSISS